MEIAASIIQAVGTIVAAIIAAGYIGRSFEKSLSSLLVTYSDQKHNAHKMMRWAKENIYVVAGVGDQFLEKYKDELEGYLKKGVKLRFLIQAPIQYYEFEQYINSKKKPDYLHYFEVRESTLRMLNRLRTKNSGEYADKIEIREFPSFLTASYIGVDIEKSDFSSKWHPHAVIQVMLYQYNVEARNSPITYFSYKNNKSLFESTADSILEMWNDGRKL